jgi:pyrroloquinoline quinone biosynthesis protein D
VNTPATAPPITPDARPRLPRGVVRLVHNEAQGGWVLLTPERVLKADPSAAKVVKRCTGEARFETIVDDLTKSFGAQRERVLADVTTLLQGLDDKKLLEV